MAIKSILVIILLYVCVIVFNSCNEEAVSENMYFESSATVITTDNVLTHATDDKYETTSDTPQFPITDEEIVEIIDNLLLYEIYGGYGSLLTSNEKDDSGMYYKVTDENFDEYSEWIDFLENLFCDKYLEMVYSETSESIVNINGYTYDDGSASGSTLSKNYTYKLFENDDHQIILTIIRDDFSYGHEGIDEKSVVLRETETGWKISDNYFP